MLDDKLETLLTVYNEKSFTKAAAKLSLTQPAISNQINMLEAQLNCTLCIRTKGQLTFTPEGEIVANYAKRFKIIYAKMQEEIALKQAQPTNIKIGVTRATESDPIVASAIGQFISSNIGINVSIISNTIKKLYEMLENYELDVIIIDGKSNNPCFSSQTLDEDCFLCIVGKENPLSQKSSITLDDLKSQHLIMQLPSSATRSLFESALESIHESISNFNIMLEMNSNTTIKLLVKKNIGVSIMPKRNCHHDLNRKRYIGIPIEDLKLTREINLVYRKDFPYTIILEEFTRMYKEVIYD